MGTSITVRDIDPGTSPGSGAKPGSPACRWKSLPAV